MIEPASERAIGERERGEDARGARLARLDSRIVDPHERRERRDEARQLEVAERASPLLEVGGEQEDRAAAPSVALRRLVDLGSQKTRRIRREKALRDDLSQLLEERPIAREESPLQECRRRVEVARERGLRLLESAHGRADLQPAVPQPAQEGLQRRGVGRAPADEQDVHVGARRELASPVATDGEDREARSGDLDREQLDEDRVDESRPRGARARVRRARPRRG